MLILGIRDFKANWKLVLENVYKKNNAVMAITFKTKNIYLFCMALFFLQYIDVLLEMYYFLPNYSIKTLYWTNYSLFKRTANRLVIK